MKLHDYLIGAVNVGAWGITLSDFELPLRLISLTVAAIYTAYKGIAMYQDRRERKESRDNDNKSNTIHIS